MTKKQYYAIQAREREEREKKIRKDYPPAKVRAVLEEGLPFRIGEFLNKKT